MINHRRRLTPHPAGQASVTKRAAISGVGVSFIAVTVVVLTLCDLGIWVPNQRRPKPAHLAGNVDKTLFADYTYLPIADKNREVYWTCKEGTSDVPHYWCREFDLDLGGSLGNIRFDEPIWSREFENALVLVNPGKQAGACSWDGAVRYHDVEGAAVSSPVTLRSRTAMLLIKSLSILPK